MKQQKTIDLKQFIKQINQTNNISKYDMSNIFSVVNKGENSYFNMSKTINFLNNDDLPQQYYTYYKIKDGDTWTNIAYNFFHNIKLWWLICKFNNIKNPFQQLIINSTIKIPTEEMLQQIINMINS